jgi:hypothetical protein
MSDRETEKRRVADDLLTPPAWGCDLLEPTGLGDGLLERGEWERLPNYNPKERKIRRRVELVE